jgi:UDP-N-acetylmuramoyl-L-alanyl-D-glutamate--2,6-diaminopimelate ligase
MCGQDFAVLVDAADSPESLRNSLRAARQVTSGRLICVFGAADDCETAVLPAIGRVIGSFADIAAITHGKLAELGAHRTILEVRSGFADTSKAQVILDRQEAIHWALAEAHAGDTVLIAGMGAEPHTPLGSEGALVNDREIVENALRGVAVNRPLRLAA